MWRLLGRIVTVGCVGLAIWLFAVAAYEQGRCEMLRRTVVTTIPVDLSCKGTYEGVFRPLHHMPHSNLLVLHAAPAFKSADDAKAALQGLSGECRVEHSHGEATVIKLAELCACWEGQRRAVFLDLRSGWADEEHRIAIRVDTPATGMQGRPHTFETVQQFCGLEDLPMLFGRALAVGCLLVAGIVELIRCTMSARREPALLDKPAVTPTESSAPG